MTMTVTDLWSQTGSKAPSPTPASPQAQEIIFPGKLFCSLKRPLVQVYSGQIASVNAKAGQAVRANETLGTYTLLPDMIPGLRRRLAGSQIRDLEVKLADANRRVTEVEAKLKTLREMVRSNLAPKQNLEQGERDLEILQQQRNALQEVLKTEKLAAKDDLALLRTQLGDSVARGHVPEVIPLRAPINGHIIWISPELRPGAVLAPQTVMIIGVLDPMLIRAQAHEIEAMKLKVGDKAEVTVESLPGRTFAATLTHRSWAPLSVSLDQPSYYDVEFTVANPDLLLKEGLKAMIKVRQAP